MICERGGADEQRSQGKPAGANHGHRIHEPLDPLTVVSHVRDARQFRRSLGERLDLGRVGIVLGDNREIESDPISSLEPGLRANVGEVVIADTRKHVVSSAVLSVEIDCPFAGRPGLETANDDVCVILLRVAVRCDCSRRVSA